MFALLVDTLRSLRVARFPPCGSAEPLNTLYTHPPRRFELTVLILLPKKTGTPLSEYPSFLLTHQDSNLE